jgi:Domain of unknown function (DUF4350)
MPLNLRTHRELILAGVAVMLLAFLVAELNSSTDKGEGTPSSYSPLRRGGKAAFLLLKQSGYNAERWEKEPGELPKQASDTVLIVAEPEGFPSEAERGAISRFLVGGGSVILAGAMPQRFVPRSAAFESDLRIGYAECKPVAPTRLTRGGSITQDGRLAWDYADDSQVTHYADENEKSVVVSYPVGKGEVVWWASAVPLINSGIQEKGNLDLLLNSIGDRRHVLWDEYFHGHKSASLPKGSVLPFKVAGIQAGLFAILLLVTFSRRSGPVVPLIRESRLSPFEFVETLGSIFHRAKNTQVAVEIASGRFRQVAVRRLGLRSNAHPEEIIRAMEGRGLAVTPQIADAVRSIDEVASDIELSEHAAVAHVRHLNEAVALVSPAIRKEEGTGTRWKLFTN